MQNIKAELQQSIVASLDDKIKSLGEQLVSVKESRDSDSKSSVGDKYETSRAMAHIEIDKLERQLLQTQQLKADLLKLNVNKPSEFVGFGSVVITKTGNYFIAVAHGKVLLNNESYYAISLASPIGNAMFQKKQGETFSFNGKEHVIESIL